MCVYIHSVPSLMLAFSMKIVELMPNKFMCSSLLLTDTRIIYRKVSDVKALTYTADK